MQSNLKQLTEEERIEKAVKEFKNGMETDYYSDNTNKVLVLGNNIIEDGIAMIDIETLEDYLDNEFIIVTEKGNKIDI